MRRGAPGFGGFPAPGYGRRRDPYRQQHLVQLLFMLGQQVAAMERKPPATLILAAINVLFHLRPEGFDFVPSVRSGCLHPARILKAGEWHRLLLSPFLHADDMHLYYNMASFLYKGALLEPSLGTVRFALLIAELALTSGLAYLAIAAAAASRAPLLRQLLGGGLMNTCAVGFSGVLFGLKVVLNHGSPGWSQIMGVTLPTKYAAWAELVVVQLLTPDASLKNVLPPGYEVQYSEMQGSHRAVGV